MNEEQAVLEFFSRAENLPLGLSVAEQMDELREQMNNRFWRELLARLNKLINQHGLAWRAVTTEDKNAPDSLVGLHCNALTGHATYLRPMLEQQYLGRTWRIYFGLMWSVPPSPDHLRLPEVDSLKAALQKAGFKNNENFLAWQWTTFHPRRKDFLLRYSRQAETLLDDIEAVLKTLLIDHRGATELANAALSRPAPGLVASLNQLRDELVG